MQIPAQSFGDYGAGIYKGTQMIIPDLEQKTKNNSGDTQVNPSLGILTKLSSTSDITAYQNYRDDRYKLQNIAADVLNHSRLSSCGKSLSPAPKEKRIISARGSEVRINKNHETGKCNYEGLMLCGNVWVCPVCAARITLERKNELLSADLEGYHTGLLTLTLKHSYRDTLSDLSADLTKMRNSLKSGRWWNEFRRDNGLAGAITIREVTYGKHGWHVHYHMLMVFNGPVNYKNLEGEIYDRWSSIAARHGRYTSRDHGVDFRECEQLDYITKWSIHSELVYGERKEGRQGNITVWEMLRRIGQGEDKYKPLFKEYAKCFKGKKQLVWGRGLKKLLGVGVEAESDGEEQENERVITICYEDWKRIIKNKERAHILRLAEVSGSVGVIARLAYLEAMEH